MTFRKVSSREKKKKVGREINQNDLGDGGGLRWKVREKVSKSS